MARYTSCPSPSPTRAVLEADHQPQYDTVQIINGDRLVPIFAQAIGTAGSIFGAAVRKTRRETSFKKDAGTMSTPQMFDAYALLLRYSPDIAFADMVSIRFNGRFVHRIGEKTFLEVPMDHLPGGSQLRVDQLVVAADVVIVGEPLPRSTQDLTVNETVYNAALSMCTETGNVVPEEWPSEQGMENALAFDDPATGVVLTANRFVEGVFLGVLKREVL